MSISPQQRTMILAAVAGLGVAGVAIDSLVRSSQESPASASPAADASPAVAVLPGAPPGDLAALNKRYRPIVLKGPFKTRDFKDRPAPRPRVDRPSRSKDPEPSRPRKPDDLLLRLTSFVGQGEARVGLFEERGSGTALFAKPGATLAGVAVRKVESERVVVLLDGKERAYKIGETLTLPASARKVLEPLRPAGSVKTESKRYTGATKLPELSEKKKMSILERLKARRRASKLRAQGKDPDAEKKEEASGAGAKPGDAKPGSTKPGAAKPAGAKPGEGPTDGATPSGEDGPPEMGPDDGGPPEMGPDDGGPPEMGPDDGGPPEMGPDDGGPPPGEEPLDDPDAPADDAPQGDTPSDDDPQGPQSPEPEPQSEDNQ